jgi:hypothetical protein
MLLKQWQPICPDDQSRPSEIVSPRVGFEVGLFAPLPVDTSSDAIPCRYPARDVPARAQVRRV